MNAHPLPRAWWPLATPRHHLRGLMTLVVGCSALILAALAAWQAPAVAAQAAAGSPRAGSDPAKSRTADAKPKTAAGTAKTKTASAKTKSKSKTETATSKSKSETAKSKSKPEAAKTKTAKSKSKARAETAKSKPTTEAPKTKTAEAAKHRARRPTVGHAANPKPMASAVPGTAAGQPNPAVNPTVFEHGPGVLGVSLRTLRQQQIKEYVSEPVAMVALALDDLRLAPVNKGTHVEVNLTDRIPFEGKGDKVPPKSRRLLDVIARILTDNPQTRIQVLVHTDGSGEAGANLRQTQRAAEAVKAYLMGKGVAAERITPIGRGDAAPLVAAGKRNPTWQERNRNRRVEIIVEPLRPVAAPTDQPALPVPASAGDQPAAPGPALPTNAKGAGTVGAGP